MLGNAEAVPVRNSQEIDMSVVPIPPIRISSHTSGRVDGRGVGRRRVGTAGIFPGATYLPSQTKMRISF